MSIQVQQFIYMCTSYSCVHLFCLFTVQFICVINLLIICLFLSTLLIIVVVFVHLNVAVGNIGHLA